MTLTSAQTPEGEGSIAFDNSYARLPERFFAPVEPAPASDPRLIRVNAPLAARLGIDADWLSSPRGLAALAGLEPVVGAQPVAMAYAGHQFGNFVPQLGDGRAVLLGEVTGTDGVRYDIQIKGSGKTPFSRGGDGQAAIGPVLREYLVSEAMAALGVPTTRALAALTTGDEVFRERVLPGARIARVAQSHVRVGTFQFFTVREDIDAVRQLADYVIDRHYPAARKAERPALALLEAVVARQAELVAHWQAIGFIHGVMNTDNVSIAGETIDYGPCAFMDEFHPSTVFSSIDRNGRYAYRNQPGVAQWNMATFAQCLLPLIDADEDRAIELAQEAVNGFAVIYEREYLGRFRAKLGLSASEEGDPDLVGNLLALMTETRADFTLTFRALADAVAGDPETLRGILGGHSDFEAWLDAFDARGAREDASADARAAAMRTVNPLYIPRNHLVEEAISAALEGDYGPFEQMMEVLATPFEAQEGRERHAAPPAPGEVVTQTFCGT